MQHFRPVHATFSTNNYYLCAMKQIFIMGLLFSIVTPLWGQTLADCDAIDMRSGLPENRVRCLAQLQDGRIVIATAATISIYDGTHFHTCQLRPENEFMLADYLGKRHLICDSTGMIWLRNTRSLYVMDSKQPRMLTSLDSLLNSRHLTLQQVSGWPADTTWRNSSECIALTQSIGKEISALLHDSYGGLWIGTKESGILYYNPARRRQFHCNNSEFLYEKKRVYCSVPRSSELSTKFAHSATNCTVEFDGYLYIGTRDGVMVVDRNDSLVAVIGEEYGLLTNNIAGLINDLHGDVWASTAGGGITRLHRTGNRSFDIVNYGILDGVQTDGQEFRTCRIHLDTTGLISVGFVGGTCTFHPDSVTTPRYTFHFPQQNATSVTNVPSTLSRREFPWWILIITLTAVAGFVFIVIRHTKKKATGENTSKNAGHQPIDENVVTGIAQQVAGTKEPTADEAFLLKLQTMIEQNLGDEDFSVQSLSEMMAMDRTVLYRRMQAVTGISPSVYIKQIRIDVAKHLLRETDMPVSDIAYKTGFSTVKYFSTTFKETVGMLPSDYRKNNMTSAIRPLT